jgi:hypothetical protein
VNGSEIHRVPLRGAAKSVAALLLAVLTLAVAAQPAGAVSVIGTALAEEWANTYGEKQCRQDGPDCDQGWAGRCRQQGKFQVTCYLYKHYYIEPSDGLWEYWKCQRRIRYTVDKGPWLHHKKWISHSKLLGPWACGAHHKVRDY